MEHDATGSCRKGFGPVQAASASGVYSEGVGAARKFLESYLSALMGLVGIEVAGVVRAEGVAMGPDKDKEAMQAARQLIRELTT